MPLITPETSPVTDTTENKLSAQETTLNTANDIQDDYVDVDADVLGNEPPKVEATSLSLEELVIALGDDEFTDEEEQKKVPVDVLIGEKEQSVVPAVMPTADEEKREAPRVVLTERVSAIVPTMLVKPVLSVSQQASVDILSEIKFSDEDSEHQGLNLLKETSKAMILSSMFSDDPEDLSSALLKLYEKTPFSNLARYSMFAERDRERDRDREYGYRASDGDDYGSSRYSPYKKVILGLDEIDHSLMSSDFAVNAKKLKP